MAQKSFQLAGGWGVGVKRCAALPAGATSEAGLSEDVPGLARFCVVLPSRIEAVPEVDRNTVSGAGCFGVSVLREAGPPLGGRAAIFGASPGLEGAAMTSRVRRGLRERAWPGNCGTVAEVDRSQLKHEVEEDHQQRLALKNGAAIAGMRGPPQRRQNRVAEVPDESGQDQPSMKSR